MNDIPYPGLRPFTREESRIFFGRDEHIGQLLDKLAEARFISVTGLSGCGKSSLVRAGLIPALECGYVADAGSEWCVLEMRPGAYPVKSLSEALIKAELSVKQHEQKPIGKEQHQEAIEKIYQQLIYGGHLEFSRILRKKALASKRRRNFLLLVDQFEEVFRYEDQGSFEERIFFVEILLTSAEQQDVPIYIVTTIRSDWIGQCVAFRVLPEVMNASQFLVPRLNREQLRMAIIRPAQIMGGEIENGLVHQLLRDIKHDSDQLPQLQHCLMRMWLHAKGREQRISQQNDITITFDDYDFVGKLENAISDHAESIFESFSPQQQALAEHIFRFLIKPGYEREEDIRYPASLHDIVTATERSEQDVKDIINQFRTPDFCFLRPYRGELSPDSEIDISHESLIRQWSTLTEWAEREAHSVQNYRRLVELAQYKEEGGGLIEPPQLDVMLEWKADHHPNKTWAERYPGDFDLTMRFLNDSKQAEQERKCQREEEHRRQEEERERQQQKELEHARKLAQEAEARQKAEEKARQEAEKRAIEQARAAKRLRWLTVGLALMFLVAVGGALVANHQRNKALRAEEEANETTDKLLFAIRVLIDSSPSIPRDQKAFWKDAVKKMDKSQLLELLRLLQQDIAEKARDERENSEK